MANLAVGGDCGQVNIFSQPSAGDPEKVPSMGKKSRYLDMSGASTVLPKQI